MEEQATLLPAEQVNNPPSVSRNGDPILDLIERLATNPDADVEKIQRIMDMQEHAFDRDAKQAFNAAMVRAQRDMPIVPKDKDNQQTHSKYSAYETILEYTKPIYTREGFSILYHEGHGTPDHPLKDHHIRMIAEVMHERGHTKTVTADIPLDDAGMQGTKNKTLVHATGSSIMYGRNYMLRMIFNIPTGDENDGNGAGTQFIDDKQLSAITDYIDNLHINEPAFCKFMKVKEVKDIKATDYNKALSFFKQKEKAK